MIYLRSFAIIIIFYTFTLAQTNMPGGITGKISFRDTNAINNIGIHIESLPIPEIVYPQNDAVDIPIVPKFVIGTVINANRYEMELSFSQSFFFNVFSRAYWEFEEPLGIDFLEWFPFISDIDDFQNNRTYYWRVRALNTITNEASQWSQIHKYQTISSGESVNQPTLIYPENNSKIPWIDVNFEWTKVNTSKWYQLQWGENGQLTQYRWSDMEHPFKKENLKPLTSYFWKVVAYNDNSISEFSNYSYFETRNAILESGFKINRDGYSFDNINTINPILSLSLKEFFKDYLFDLVHVIPFIKLIFHVILHGNGNCYGMSASSIMYYNYNYLIPSPYTFTYQIELNNQEAIENITYYQRVQAPNIYLHLLGGLFYNSEKDKYKKIVNKISDNHPLLVDLSANDNDKKIGHAIVAYKVKEYTDSSHIYVYDVNNHTDTTRYITYINEQGNERFNNYGIYTDINFYDPADDILPMAQFIEILKQKGLSYFDDLISNSKNLFTFSSSSYGNYAINESTPKSWFEINSQN